MFLETVLSVCNYVVLRQVCDDMAVYYKLQDLTADRCQRPGSIFSSFASLLT